MIRVATITLAATLLLPAAADAQARASKGQQMQVQAANDVDRKSVV